jgi:hypothetical protein
MFFFSEVGVCELFLFVAARALRVNACHLLCRLTFHTGDRRLRRGILATGHRHIR